MHTTYPTLIIEKYFQADFQVCKITPLRQGFRTRTVLGTTSVILGVWPQFLCVRLATSDCNAMHTAHPTRVVRKVFKPIFRPAKSHHFGQGFCARTVLGTTSAILGVYAQFLHCLINSFDVCCCTEKTQEKREARTIKTTSSKKGSSAMGNILAGTERWKSGRKLSYKIRFLINVCNNDYLFNLFAFA